MRMLMYVLTVVAVLAIAVLCLRSCRPPAALEPAPAQPAQVAPPAALPEPLTPPPAPLPPPSSALTNTVSAPAALDATLVTLDVILSGQRGIPYEGTVQLDPYDSSQEYSSRQQSRRVNGASAVSFSNVPPADCHVIARLNGYLTMTTNVPLTDAAGTCVRIVLALEPARSLRGTVVDATTEAPLAHAGVALIARGTNTLTCDALGGFVFEEVQDSVMTLAAWHDAYPTQQFRIQVMPDAVAVVPLLRAARIVGTVQQESGQAVTGCTVVCYDMQRDLRKSRQEQVRTITDGAGFFDFPALQPGERMRVDAYGAEQFGHVEVALQPGEEREVLLVLSNAPPQSPRSNGWIRLIAHDTVGTPITNGTVWFTDDGLSMLEARFDMLGEFVFVQNVGTTEFMLMVKRKPPLTLTNITVKYHETTTVHAVVGQLVPRVMGDVRRANGMPAVGISIIAAQCGKAAGIRGTATTDQHGEFELLTFNPSCSYTLTTKCGIQINSPCDPVKPGDVVHLTLKPYSLVMLQAVASNTLMAVSIGKCSVATAPGAESTSVEMGFPGRDGAHAFAVTCFGSCGLTLHAAGYKPVTLERTFRPDEDVNLGTVYFEPAAPE